MTMLRNTFHPDVGKTMSRVLPPLPQPALLPLLLLLLLTGLPCALAEEPPAGETLDEASAKTLLDKISREIRTLQAELESARSESRQEQDRLKTIDLSIQQTNRSLRNLESQRLEHARSLKELGRQKREFIDGLEQQKDELVGQIRNAYRISRQSPLQLALNQDDPARLSRTLAYYGYISRSQVSHINKLKVVLAELEQMQISIDRELDRLTQVSEEQQRVIHSLNLQRDERAVILNDLLGRIDSDEAQLEELVRNRRDLETLLEKLENALSDIPGDLGKRLGVAPQKGKLDMPVKGRISHAFGQKRAGGMNWQGWLIRSSPGTEVRTVAYGRVAYADWLRGYGLLMIIDHGDGYMSLYGNNETLFKEVGDWVEPMEPIALVGAGSNGEEGLYFELRKNGKALDPAAWLQR
jgi:septal ring factor EnvC (AmiA/AmiB activator)